MSFPIEHFPDAHFPDAHFPHVYVAPIPQGGGGGKKKRKPFKSWDQRQREREAEIKAHQEAIAARENRDKYGDLPPALADALAETREPNKPLSAHTMREYQRLRPEEVAAVLRGDDEEAFALILGLL